MAGNSDIIKAILQRMGMLKRAEKPGLLGYDKGITGGTNPNANSPYTVPNSSEALRRDFPLQGTPKGNVEPLMRTPANDYASGGAINAALRLARQTGGPVPGIPDAPPLGTPDMLHHVSPFGHAIHTYAADLFNNYLAGNPGGGGGGSPLDVAAIVAASPVGPGLPGSGGTGGTGGNGDGGTGIHGSSTSGESAGSGDGGHARGGSIGAAGAGSSGQQIDESWAARLMRNLNPNYLERAPESKWLPENRKPDFGDLPSKEEWKNPNTEEFNRPTTTQSMARGGAIDAALRMARQAGGRTSPVPEWLLEQQKEAQAADAPLHGQEFPSGVFKPAATLAELTGVPSAVRGAQAYNKGDLGEAAGEAVGALPLIGKVAGPAFRAAKSAAPYAVGAGLGMLGLPSQAGSDAPSPIDKLNMQKEDLIKQRALAVQLRNSNAPAGGVATPEKHPKFFAATEDIRNIDRQLMSIDKQIETANQRSDPEYQRQQKLLEQTAEQDRRAQEVNRPWRERNPELASNWPWIVPAAAAGAAGLTVAGQKFNRFMHNMPWRSAVNEARDLVSTGQTKAAPVLQELKEFNKTYKPTEGAGALPALVGGSLGAELGMYPIQSDVMNLGFDKAVQNPWELGKAGITTGLGALTGGTAGKFAHSWIPESRSPIESSRAYARLLSQGAEKDAGTVARNMEAMGIKPSVVEPTPRPQTPQGTPPPQAAPEAAKSPTSEPPKPLRQAEKEQERASRAAKRDAEIRLKRESKKLSNGEDFQRGGVVGQALRIAKQNGGAATKDNAALGQDIDAYLRSGAGHDHAHYLPESVGDIPYRYQGVGVHGAMAAHGAAEVANQLLKPRASRNPVALALGALSGLANGGYSAWSLGTGRARPRPDVGPVEVLDRQPYQTGGAVVHAGPIQHAADGGRTDTVPLDVAPGSYVIPADIISGIGQGDTTAGYRALEGMFGPQGPKPAQGAGGPPVPILAAGGEFVISPDAVGKVGGGDLKRGHEALDLWVKMQRRKIIQELSKLPGPAKD